MKLFALRATRDAEGRPFTGAWIETIKIGDTWYEYRRSPLHGGVD